MDEGALPLYGAPFSVAAVGGIKRSADGKPARASAGCSVIPVSRELVGVVLQVHRISDSLPGGPCETVQTLVVPAVEQPALVGTHRRRYCCCQGAIRNPTP